MKGLIKMLLFLQRLNGGSISLAQNMNDVDEFTLPKISTTTRVLERKRPRVYQDK